MIRHIVMWKMDSSYSEEEKISHINAFSEKLMELKGKIPVLKSISTSINATNAAESNFGLILDTTFENMDDLKTYAIHPEHLKVVEFSKSHKKERACIDFEF